MRHRFPWDWETCGPKGWAWPGMRGRFFEAGEVRLALLSLLAEGPRHGYELMKMMEARSGGTYRVSAGSIYPTLQQLEDEGLIASEQQDGKKVYQITDAGREELACDSETVDEIWKRAERWGEWGRWTGPESYVVFPPIGALVKSVFRAAHNARGDKAVLDRIVQIVENASREIEALKKPATN